MDAQAEQIVKDIQSRRERLGDSIAELETRMRDSVDWHTYFHRQPWMMLGAAALGGMLLAAMVVPKRQD